MSGERSASIRAARVYQRDPCVYGAERDILKSAESVLRPFGPSPDRPAAPAAFAFDFRFAFLADTDAGVLGFFGAPFDCRFRFRVGVGSSASDPCSDNSSSYTKVCISASCLCS